MGSLNTDSIKKDIAISSIKQMEEYLINAENSMLSLLKLYLQIIAITGTLLAYFQNSRNERLTQVVNSDISGVLFLIVGILGLYVLQMYVELRIRKIRTLEEIVLLREKLIEEFGANNFVGMIREIKRCPPYLRRPSSEWYTVIFLSFLNCIIFTVGLSSFTHLPKLTFLQTLPSWSIKFLVGIVIFLCQYRWVTKYTYFHDLKREKDYKVSNIYDFLDSGNHIPLLFKLFNYLSKYQEHRLRYKYQWCKDKNSENITSCCEFCKSKDSEEGAILKNRYFYSKWDTYPVSQGHALIIPKRHVYSLFQLTFLEVISLYKMLKKTKLFIQNRYNSESFNIGINEGKVAGQTIAHLHVHLIPRYNGDVADPEGGIRNVIPGKGKYQNNV